ncbi:MAG: hypothetical protein GY715_02705 [Planctomycetes bacterium]|nr:hypothetical protein [Planctomycetota bacterium]
MPGNSGDQIECNDDSCGGMRSQITTDLADGQSVLVRVSGSYNRKLWMVTT